MYGGGADRLNDGDFKEQIENLKILDAQDWAGLKTEALKIQAPRAEARSKDLEKREKKIVELVRRFAEQPFDEIEPDLIGICDIYFHRLKYSSILSATPDQLYLRAHCRENSEFSLPVIISHEIKLPLYS